MANLTINDGGIVINTRNIASADLRYGPYNSLSEARAATSGVEAEGLTVGIREDNSIIEYWYRLIPDETTGRIILDLVKKTPELKTVNGESIIGEGNIPIEFANGAEISEVGIDELPDINNANNLVTSKGIAIAIKNLQDQIIEISKDVFPLIIDFTSSLQSPATFTGNKLDTTLIWNTRIGDLLVAPDTVVIKQDDDIIYELDQTAEPPYEHGSKTGDHCNTFIEKYGTTVFTIEATAEGMTKRSEIDINVVLSSFVGFYPSAEATLATMKSSLNAYTVDEVGNLSGTYILGQLEPSSYLTIAIPEEFTISEVTSSGFEIPMMDAVEDNTVTIGGRAVVYKVYRSVNKFEEGSVTIKVY